MWTNEELEEERKIMAKMFKKSGIVAYINKNKGSKKGQFFYNFNLEGNTKQYFSTGLDKPSFTEGAEISFEYSKKKNGKYTNRNVDMDSLEVTKEGGGRPSYGSKSGGKSSGGKASSNDAINLTSARRQAIDTVNVALTHSCLSEVAKAKVGDRMDQLLAKIDDLTVHFLEQYNDIDALLEGNKHDTDDIEDADDDAEEEDDDDLDDDEDDDDEDDE